MNLYKKKSKPKDDRPHNAINGHDAEAYGKSKIGMALSAEINTSSREMDNDKIDFHLNFQHPWESEQLILHFQAKSGEAYGEEISEERFKLIKKVIENQRKATRSTCIIWVSRTTNNVYWSYVHTNSVLETTEYGIHHQVTPATKYDLVRCFEQHNSRHIPLKGAKGIVIRPLKKTFSENREHAKLKYRTLKKSNILNPVLGKIECTRLAWRHITRKDRKNEFKITSFNTASYLKSVLNTLPSTIALLNCKYEMSKNNITRTTEYILKYEAVMLSVNTSTGPRKKPITVVVRTIETIIYPINWTEDSQLSQTVKRAVTLKSFYYKE